MISFNDQPSLIQMCQSWPSKLCVGTLTPIQSNALRKKLSTDWVVMLFAQSSPSCFCCWWRRCSRHPPDGVFNPRLRCCVNDGGNGYLPCLLSFGWWFLNGQHCIVGVDASDLQWGYFWNTSCSEIQEVCQQWVFLRQVCSECLSCCLLSRADLPHPLVLHMESFWRCLCWGSGGNVPSTLQQQHPNLHFTEKTVSILVMVGFSFLRVDDIYLMLVTISCQSNLHYFSFRATRILDTHLLSKCDARMTAALHTSRKPVVTVVLVCVTHDNCSVTTLLRVVIILWESTLHH